MTPLVGEMGNIHMASDVLSGLIAQLRQANSEGANGLSDATLLERFESLTSGERRVLPLVVSGRPNKQIAAEIGTSEATVKAHRSQLMRKMGAQSLAELVRMSERLTRNSSMG